MTFVEKVSKREVYDFIVDFDQRYPDHVPAVGLMAGMMKVTPKTIKFKLNDLEALGAIIQIKKVKNNVTYKLIRGFQYPEE